MIGGGNERLGNRFAVSLASSTVRVMVVLVAFGTGYGWMPNGPRMPASIRVELTKAAAFAVVKTSAAASRPVYLVMIGAAAGLRTSDRPVCRLGAGERF